MSQLTAARRVRAFGYFVIAAIYFFFAQLVASHSANGLASGDWSELVERLILLFLLLVGYGAMGRTLEGQRRPLEAMGLVLRPGSRREFALGAALGWGMLIASILPMVLLGGLIVSVWTDWQQFAKLALDLVVLAVAALAEEVAFRGYPFQRLIEAIGPVLATLVISGLFGVAHILNPAANRASVTVTIFAGWLLCAAYLRTRALWFSWGWHFAWNASMGLLFGLPISGLTRFSPVIQSNTIGPAWLTGGDYGPEGSLVGAIVILIGVILTFRITRAYAYQYAQPVIVPGGMPVDPDAMNRSPAALHPPAAGENLVQLQPYVQPQPNSGPVAAFSVDSPAEPEPPPAAVASSPEPPPPTPSSAPESASPLPDPRDPEN